MFENIIGQDKLVETIKHDLTVNNLPQSILISGAEFSGKLTIALETARALSCEFKTANWPCGCNSCRLHRTLSHPNMLLLSSRKVTAEIRASLSILQQFDKSFSRYMFIRSVKKMINRGSPLVWTGNETKIKSSTKLLNEIEEELSSIYPQYKLPHAEVLKAAVSIEKKAIDIAKKKVFSNISVDMVRKASFWAHTSSDYERKIVIIDSIDHLSENSRNALLKTLEEPPAGVYFILLAANKGSVLPTILSRVRQYSTVQRGIKKSEEVLKRIFREEQIEYSSIRQFFLAYSDLNLEEVKNDCLRFIQSVNENNVDPEQIAALADKYKNDVEDFLQEFLFTMRELLAKGESVSHLSNWYQIIMDNQVMIKRYNSSGQMVLEKILYGISV